MGGSLKKMKGGGRGEMWGQNVVRRWVKDGRKIKNDKRGDRWAKVGRKVG